MSSSALSRRVLLRSSLALLTLSGPAFAEGDAKVNVAFIGDSMIDGIWGGALRAVSKDQCLSPQFKLGRFGENGTGLTRPGNFDWIGKAKTIVATFKPQLVVVSLGLNDRQNIVDLGKNRFELGSPEWRTRYEKLVSDLVLTAADVPAGLLWIGVPVLRDAVAQADALEKNATYKRAIEALNNPKFEYVEPWQAEGGATGFELYGVGPDGARAQVRANDGIHFTSLGYDLVAHHLLPKMLKRLSAASDVHLLRC